MTELDKPMRCAIYTRKSTDEGLEKEFNSLDAQREAGEAFVASQRHRGWTCLPDSYDDGGFSGGNVNRHAQARRQGGRGGDVQAHLRRLPAPRLREGRGGGS